MDHTSSKNCLKLLQMDKKLYINEAETTMKIFKK